MGGLSGHPGHAYDVVEHATVTAAWMDADRAAAFTRLLSPAPGAPIRK
jgi:hypothetical protein